MEKGSSAFRPASIPSAHLCRQTYVYVVYSGMWKVRVQIGLICSSVPSGVRTASKISFGPGF